MEGDTCISDEMQAYNFLGLLINAERILILNIRSIDPETVN